MKKLNLSAIADEFESISSEMSLFYNTETGEFDFFSDLIMTIEESNAKAEEFDDDAWIAAPSQQEFGEYDMMSEFADSVTDPHKNEMLSVALEGKGAFRRFKDTVYRLGLEDEWYKFKRKAYAEVAREWCERNKIEYIDDIGIGEPEPEQTPEGNGADGPVGKTSAEIAVTMETLESHNHIVGDIERGVKVYKGGGVEYEEHEQGFYWARVPHKYGPKTVTVVFTKDGRDIKTHSCHCTINYKNPPVCRHVVAAVLAIQGGAIESGLTLGKNATASTTVNENNTAKAVWSGSLDVFATPMMIALMEKAACECLVDVLDPGQTSVGTVINVSHTAASPIGMDITATATIEAVFGRKVEFLVTASDESGEIGKGKHTRVIVDSEKFLKKAKKKG